MGTGTHSRTSPVTPNFPHMRILFLSNKLPGPKVDGYVIRSQGLLGRFNAIAEVDHLAYDVGATPKALRHGMRSESTFPVPSTAPPSLITKVSEVLSPQGIFHWYPGFAAMIREHCQSQTYDLIWLAGSPMIQYAPVVRAHAPNAKVVADVADDDVRGYQIERRKATSPRRRLELWRSIVRLQRFEQKNFPKCDAVLYVSHVDAETAGVRHPRARIEVLQNGVDTDKFAPAVTPATGPILVFEGTMDFPPNVEAALHFGRNIFPRIKQRMPEAKALIVGRNPVDQIKAMHSEDFVVTGTVDDVRETVLKGSVFACPMLGGIGQKNKILQAWSMGLPIVATHVAAAGLDARHGDNIILTDDPGDFADRAVDLLQDEGLRRRIGAAGRDTALDVYSIPAKMRLVEEFVRDLVQESPRSRGRVGSTDPLTTVSTPRS